MFAQVQWDNSVKTTYMSYIELLFSLNAVNSAHQMLRLYCEFMRTFFFRKPDDLGFVGGLHFNLGLSETAVCSVKDCK